MLNLALVTTAVGLGVAYAASPGAVNTEAIRRGIAHGARSTLFVEMGSLIGDSLWAVLALAGITVFARHLAVQVILGIAGGCFLLRMAWLALHEALVARPVSAAPSPGRRGDFMTGVVFGLANPVGLAFWSGLGSSVVASGVVGVQFVLFFLGFFAGAVLWSVGISAAIRWGRRWVRPAFFRWVNALCGLALGYFGIRVLWTTVQAWIEQQVISSLKSAH
jgi:chemosensory pili system protein ChpE